MSEATPNRVRCAIYTRKSTTHNLDTDFSSLDAQRESCEHYVRAHAHEGWEVVKKRYDDGGFTGANTDRPAFQALMDDIDAKRVDVVLVYKLDRLSRSLLDFAKMMERFEAAGIEFVSVTQNFSTANALGKLTLNILMSFAQFEREMISERTRDKIRAARRRGMWTGGRAPYGYELVDRALVPSPLEAKGVREIFDLYLEHRSLMAVTRTLGLRGRTKREDRGGTALPWTKQDVQRVLRHPVYAGLIEADGEWIQGRQEPLIPRATFDEAQHHLDGRTTVGGPQRNPEYLLRGVLRCGACGGLMTAASSRRGDREYRYYRCSSRMKRGMNACVVGQVPAEALERFAVDRLRDALERPGFVPEVRARLEARVEHERRELQQERAELPRALARLRSNADSLIRQLDLALGPERAALSDEIERATEAVRLQERRLVDVNRRLGAVEHVEVETAWITRALTRFHELWEMMTPDNRGRLLRAVITSVSYDDSTGVLRTVLVPAGAEATVDGQGAACRPS